MSGTTCPLLVFLLLIGSHPRVRGEQRPQPAFLASGEALLRQGRFQDALALYQSELAASPSSLPAHNAAGIVLDFMNRTAEARGHFLQAAESATLEEVKAAAHRQVAISHAFDGDCPSAARHDGIAFDIYVRLSDIPQQVETAEEAAWICRESGDLDAALRWTRAALEAASSERSLDQDAMDRLELRSQLSRAAIAARVSDGSAQARQLLETAQALRRRIARLSRAESAFVELHFGDVAFLAGDLELARGHLSKADQADPFVQCRLGQVFEKMGEGSSALDFYRRASSSLRHDAHGAAAQRISRIKLAAVPPASAAAR